MIFLYIAAMAVVLTLAYMRYETTQLKTSHIRYVDYEDPLKIVHMSDLHLSYLRVNMGKIIRVLQSEKPDLVILTGDYITKIKHMPMFLKFIETIKGDHKIFLCLGNHDYNTLENDEIKISKFKKKVEKSGATVLLNDSRCFEKDKRKYNIIGIEDLRSKRYNIESSLKSCNKNMGCNIAFSHNPDIVFKIPEGYVDYLLCGHFHGGQIWMPFNLEFRILRNEVLCKMGITRGAHKVKGINLYISRGLGNVCFPLRFLSTPEIAILYV